MLIKKLFYSARFKTSLFTIISFCCFISVSAQTEFYKSYNWPETKEYSKIDAKSKLILIKKEIIEFHYDNDDKLVEYYLKHQKEYLVTDKDIEESNRRFITFANESELVFAKARVQKPDGKVIVLDNSKILDAVNEETGEKSKYFAFEGIEKGSIIEYMFVVKKAPSYYGRTVQMQENDSTLNYSFDLVAPSNLIFKFKTQNDTTKAQYDTTYKEKNRWAISLENIPGLKEEPFAPMNLLYKQLIFKLDRNTSTGGKDIASYGNASQNVYNNVHANITKADQKVFDKIIKEIYLPKDASTDDKIWKIDNYLKTNIQIEENGDQSDAAADIYATKQASDFGMIRLYAALFEKLGIDYNIVLTCDRTICKFDKEFESYRNITDYLMYFPTTEKFLTPSKYAYRYGLVPYQFTDNYGVFIKETSLGDFKTGVGKVKYIPPSAYKETYSNLDMKVTISDSVDDVIIDTKDAGFGHYAIYTQPYIRLINETNLKNYIETILKNQMNSIEILDWKTENTGTEAVGKLPFILISKSRNNALIEKAGNNYLFKVGELIGPQMEMYSEEERKLPLYSDYKRQYIRHIEVTLPNGYLVKNLSDINIYTDSEKDGKKVLMFNSHYTIDGNKLVIDIEEFYDQLYFDKDEYQSYRKVVNSASDFNKVVLILEKK
jgi:hypothetical protein